MKALIMKILAPILTIGGISGAVAIGSSIYEQQWNQLCDGVSITETCKDEEGVKYAKYIYHEAIERQTEIVHYDEIPAVTHTVHHPAEPAKTHTVFHPTQYGTRKVADGCIRTTISYKHGTCALSQCWDGEYSGSAGWGTCNYHGGVRYTGGPWYTYHEETYVIKEAWIETVVDVPAKDAWDETIVDAEAIPAHDDEEVVIEAQDAYYEKVRA